MSNLTDKIEKIVGGAIFTSNIDKKALKDILIEVAQSAENGGGKIYKGLVTQVAVANPTDVEKVNTLGTTVGYTRTGVGTNIITFGSAILTPTNFAVKQGAGNEQSLVSLWIYYKSPTELFMEVYDSGNTNITIPLADGVMTNQYVEIEIFE